MQAWLTHPAVQSGLVPFVTALIIAELFQRLRLSGLAIIAGFAATVYLISDFNIEPLTASRKIILLGLASAAIGLLVSPLKNNWPRPLLALAASGAAIWMAQRILQQQSSTDLLAWGAGLAALSGWLVLWNDLLHNDSVRAGSAGLGLGIGVGGAALFAGSALLGQLSLALGAAAGAYLLIQMLANSPLPGGRLLTLPSALIPALCVSLAALTTPLPWYVLPVIATIPVAAQVPVPAKAAVWLQCILTSLATLLCAGVAVYLTWRVAGAPPL